MPHVKLLVELLRKISLGGESSEGLAQLEALIGKISQTTDHVHIEADYDGLQWKWKVVQSNIQASQWTPARLGPSADHKH